MLSFIFFHIYVKDPILFYRCLSILDMQTQMWVMNEFITKNLVHLWSIVISEDIIIESGNLFLNIYFIKSEQSFEMPQRKIKLKATYYFPVSMSPEINTDFAEIYAAISKTMLHFTK